jgi:hypothetical protein
MCIAYGIEPPSQAGLTGGAMHSVFAIPATSSTALHAGWPTAERKQETMSANQVAPALHPSLSLPHCPHSPNAPAEFFLLVNRWHNFYMMTGGTNFGRLAAEGVSGGVNLSSVA